MSDSGTGSGRGRTVKVATIAATSALLLAVVLIAAVVLIVVRGRGTHGGKSSSSGSNVATSTTQIALMGDLSLPANDSDRTDGNVGALYQNGDGCTGGASVGFSDIAEGTSVTIFDQDGAVIGTTTLEAGTYSSADESCHFSWSATVPSAPFFEVEISYRGKLTYTLAEAEGGTLTTSLGASQ